MILLRKLGLEGALIAVGAALILLANGCAEESTTAPTDRPQVPREPNLVIRGLPDDQGGCIPEVIRETTDSIETVLVTFNVPPSEFNGCFPNLVPWGIDMADPVGVDTPQGSSRFVVEGGSEWAINIPSPPHAGRNGFFTPAKVMIEFDPPIRSAEFYYSRRKNERAYWGLQEAAGADSMLVRGMSRTPGTTSFETWASKVLYSNVAHEGVPYDTWTKTQLSSGVWGDTIQWLWFDGSIMIDDLKVIRKPLNCKATDLRSSLSVRRGSEVRCEFKATPEWTVTKWVFTPDAAGVDSVQEATSSRVWRGIAAASGLVKVYVTDGTTSRTWQARLSVLSRDSQWKLNMNYRQGPEQLLPDEEFTSASINFGVNCPQQFAGVDLCNVNWEILQPDPVKVGPGYATTEITSGPNKGYWIPSNIHYSMKRVGNVHPGILLSSLRKHPVPPVMLTKACKQGLGLKPTATSASANMNQVNTYCGLSGLPGIDMRVFVPGVFGHEGEGYEVGVGHYDLQKAAALEPWNDPYLAIEDLISTSAADLESRIRTKIDPIAADLIKKQADTNEVNGGPKNNYTSPSGTRIYYWESGVWNHQPFDNRTF